MGGKASFTPAFDAWRFYADGTESGSSPYGGAAQDANVSVNVGSGNVQIHLRARIQETGGAAGATTDDWGLEYQVGGSGPWTAITAASSRVRSDTGSSLTDGSATTNRGTNGITDGTGSFVAGEQEEANGVIENSQLTASNFTEHVWALLVIAADNSNAETLDFRITLNGGSPGMTNSVAPRITIVAPVADALLADDVSSATSVSSPTVGQEHSLNATDVSSAAAVSSPAVGQEHALTATGVSSATSVSSPAIAITIPLLAEDLSSATSVSSPAVGQEHGLLADDLASTTSVSAPQVGQIHALSATGVSSATSVSAPTLAETGGTDALLADDISSATSVSSPAVGQEHGLLADDVGSATSVSSPAVGQIHALTADDLSIATSVDSPQVGQEHALTVTGVSSATGVSAPVLTDISAGTVALLADDISSATSISAPALTVIGQPVQSSGGGGGGGPGPREYERRVKNQDRERLRKWEQKRRDEQRIDEILRGMVEGVKESNATPVEAITEAAPDPVRQPVDAQKLITALTAKESQLSKEVLKLRRELVRISDMRAREIARLVEIERDDDEAVEMLMMAA